MKTKNLIKMTVAAVAFFGAASLAMAGDDINLDLDRSITVDQFNVESNDGDVAVEIGSATAYNKQSFNLKEGDNITAKDITAKTKSGVNSLSIGAVTAGIPSGRLVGVQKYD